MSNPISAQEFADRIKAKLAAAKPPRSVDGFSFGDPATAARGIATTFVPTLEVLRRAAAGRKNLIVAREPPFWNRGAQAMGHDPLFALKQEFMVQHKLVIWRLRDAWDAQPSSAQRRGLARALGWDKYPKASDQYYQVPETTLRALAGEISGRLRIHCARVIGDPRAKVAKVALTHGMITVPDLARVLKEPGVDAVVIGEPVEWEASPYFQDVIASGQKKGLIVIGLAASEEPGCAEMAAWLKSFIEEVPVEWIPAGEPFAAGRWS
jgi:putative NIF3 family GTP cyclohydrolase 1 type 2